ncbi:MULTISPECIES: ABC transporter ATP-binding protein [unclassified Aliiroseovarius]|uniref:ABC transporter ATP-binding protein n=1 Tax=unclassified Aliiroseovarius TaxID=2623558 RepID=UPI00156977D9|nr:MULTISPECIES: ABC transporter ATP-binding protein [unclassified Aliiroseovarius]NRP12040.1 Oligopeptide transport ATP-binding protein OppF [Aliiroseovarius sp. xm-d-517]NRP41466.1 Oligopeptide transport ATP-binding protein OppF [Aliiroseovarius sp. xm-m-339-2]NRP44818.1 Oligopeptide transport ATP-binding protein OppF [Aliiroseovarius sp. xm-m-378]NRP62472.1 Oligopeptide transport ATP-binding protein OppF [Aliiroseovarius sp. xm-a-151]NRP65689.1 Oligopeptide transport ATP-binding protein Opp
MTLLDVKDLHTSYGAVNVLAGVSFKVEPGETYALVGESGSGKTTVIRAIAGLAPAQEGSVLFDGQQIRGLPERAMRPLRKDIAMMFQDPVGSLSPRLTIRSLITEPYRIQGMSDRDLDAEAKRLLEMVNLPAHFADRYPYQLSGGQARRVGVARALALEPKLILADEPTAGLDVSVQGELLNLMNELREKLGLAMVIITHNLNVVRHVADRMGIMYLGRLVEEGDTETIFADPRHPYTHCLLSANPEPDPDARLDRIALKGEPPSLLKRPSGCEFRERCPFAKPFCTNVPQWEVENGHGLRCLSPMLAGKAA